MHSYVRCHNTSQTREANYLKGYLKVLDAASYINSLMWVFTAANKSMKTKTVDVDDKKRVPFIICATSFPVAH